MECFAQVVFEFGRGNFGMKFALIGHGDIAGFLADHDSHGVGGLGYAERRAVTQSQRARYGCVVTHGQNATCRSDAVLIDNHSPVVQRGVLEEDILDEALVDFGVDNIAGAFVSLEGHALTDNDERSGLGFGHRHAGVHDGHGYGAVLYCFFILAVTEQTVKESPAFMASEGDKKALNLILKQYDKDKHAYAHELVEDGAGEFERENLRGHKPCHNKGHHSVENAESAGLFHQFIHIVEQCGNQKYVEYVLYSEIKHCYWCIAL